MISIKNVIAIPEVSIFSCSGCVYEGKDCKQEILEAKEIGLVECQEGYIYIPKRMPVSIAFEPDGESFRLNVCGKQSKVFDVYDLCPEGVEAVEDAVQFICEELGIEVTENGRLVL